MKAYPKTYKDFEFIQKNNYTVSDLKKIGQMFNVKWKLKLKAGILEEASQYFKLSYYASKIQNQWKKYMIRQFNLSQGPAMFNRKLCNNVDDFLTTESMREISYHFFISFRDKDQFIYGFNLISIYNLISKNTPNNPYTRIPFTDKLIGIVKQRIVYNRIFKQTEHFIHDEVPIQTNDNKIMTLFQKMDSLGNYTQHEWLTHLEIRRLRRFILELYDIWTHRAQLSNEIKYIICPPNGSPFINIPIQNINHNNSIDKEELKYIIIEIISRLINTAVTPENQSLGAYYVLTALTLVSPPAAEAMPWLYYSVV